jgi:aminoglycoside phosphotransferase (APT) family kinase protein
MSTDPTDTQEDSRNRNSPTAAAPLAQIEVSADLAATLIEEQFPELAPLRLEVLGIGWDNTAFRVNDAFVFRFPRRDLAVPLIAKEAILLPWLASKVPLSLPCPRFVGTACERYPWPFLGSTYVTGVPASSAKLADETRGASAARLGEFLAALHELRPPEPIAGALGPDTLGRLDFEARIPVARDRLIRLKSLGLVPDPKLLLEILELFPRDFSPRSDTLVHGDLHALHLMVDDSGVLTGAIDWGDAHFGDPAADLMAAHIFLPARFHGEFRRSYGPISDSAWQAARLRGLWHSATVLEYAHGIADQTLVREAQRALAFLSIE